MGYESLIAVINGINSGLSKFIIIYVMIYDVFVIERCDVAAGLFTEK